MNRWFTCIVVASAGWVVGFPGPAEAAVPCKRTCKDSLVVGGQAVEWRSPERFGSEAGVTGVGVEVRLGRKALLETERLSSCAWFVHRRGVSARVSTCGDPARVVVRIASSRSKPTRVRVLYRAFF